MSEISTEDRGGVTVVRLPEVSDLTVAPALRTAVLESPGQCVVNGSVVERITTPTVQVLVSALKNPDVRLAELSLACETALRELGVLDELSDRIDAA